MSTRWLWVPVEYQPDVYWSNPSGHGTAVRGRALPTNIRRVRPQAPEAVSQLLWSPVFEEYPYCGPVLEYPLSAVFEYPFLSTRFECPLSVR